MRKGRDGGVGGNGYVSATNPRPYTRGSSNRRRISGLRQRKRCSWDAKTTGFRVRLRRAHPRPSSLLLPIPNPLCFHLLVPGSLPGEDLPRPRCPAEPCTTPRFLRPRVSAPPPPPPSPPPPPPPICANRPCLPETAVLGLRLPSRAKTSGGKTRKTKRNHVMWSRTKQGAKRACVSPTAKPGL